MQLSLFAFLLILVNSATLKQDANANSLQPLQAMIQLFGDTLDFALRDADRQTTQLVFPGQADAMLTQLLDCDDTLWSDILPQILSSDLERLTATCQDTNRTTLLNTMLQDIVQGVANSTDPCIAFFARFDADIVTYVSAAITQGWQFDLGWTSSGQQFSVPLDTVVDNLQQVPGFLANGNDRTDSTIVGLTDAINTLSGDVAITELADTDDFATVVESELNAMTDNGNQQLYQALVQFLNEAATLLCPIIGPTPIDTSESNS